MANGLIDSLVDIEKLSAEIKTLENMLNGLSSHVGASLQEVTRIFRDELKKIGDMDFKGLRDTLGSLSKEMHGVAEMGARQQQVNNQLIASQNKLAAASRDVKNIVALQIGTIEQNVAAQERHIKIIEGLKKEQSDLKNAFKAGMISQKEYASTTESLSIQLAEEKAALSETNIVLRQQAKENIAVEGSITQLGNSLGQMKKAYRDMSASERESPIGQALLDDIQRLDKAVKEADAAIGNHQRNVGNYSSALTGSFQTKLNELQATLEGAQKAMSELARTSGVNTQEYQELQKKVADTATQISGVKDAMLAATQESTAMGIKMRELTKEMRNLQEAIKNGTATDEMKKRFQEVAKEASDVQNTIDRVNSRIRIMASNSAGIQTIVSSMQMVNAAFQVSQGILVELGMEGEAVADVHNKLNAAYNVSNGLLTISNMLKQKNALMTVLDSAATSKSVVVKGAATLAQKALNAAQNNMPLLALIAGIALLVGWLGKYALSSSKISKEQQILNDVQGKAVDLYAENAAKIEILSARMARASKNIGEQEQVLTELNKELENSGKKFNTVQEAEQWLIAHKDEYIQALEEQAKAQAAINIYTDAYKKLLEDQSKPQEEFIGFWEKFGIAMKNTYNMLSNHTAIYAEWAVAAAENQEAALAASQNTMDIALNQASQFTEQYKKLFKALGLAVPGELSTQAAKIQESLVAWNKTELQKLREKYVAEKALLESQNQDTTLLTKKYHQDVAAINEKAAAEQQKLIEKIHALRINAMRDGKEKELAALAAAEEKELAAVVGNATQRAEQVALIEAIAYFSIPIAHFSNRNVEVSNPIVEVSIPIAHFSNRNVEVSNPIVEVSNPIVEVSNRIVEVSNPIVEVSNRNVEVSNRKSFLSAPRLLLSASPTKQ